MIIDNSGSVGEVFNQEKEVAAKLIDSLPVSPTAVRVALVDFNSKADTVFSFNQYADNTAVSQALRSLNASGGSTNVVEALNAANQEFSKARPNVKKVLLIITDGQSQNTIEMINTASTLLNTSGIEVFAASASDSVGLVEFDLYTVSHRERIFLKNNVSSLPDSVGKFVAGGGSCGAPTESYVKPPDPKKSGKNYIDNTQSYCLIKSYKLLILIRMLTKQEIINFLVMVYCFSLMFLFTLFNVII